MRRLLVLVIAIAGCGDGDDAPAPPPAPAGPTSIVATPADADDPVVATVDGRPVYGSCVEAQARHLGLDRDAALEQCVRFELLAGVAEARGLIDDPDVVEAWRRELVRAVIDDELGDLERLEDLPEDFLAPLLAKHGAYLQRPELRALHYARAFVPREAPVDSPADVAARRVMEAAYAELRDEEGVLPDELVRVAERHAAGTDVKIQHSDKPFPTPKDDLPNVRGAVQPVREAVWALPEIGRISPPVRTPWGWDLILWHQTIEAADLTASYFEFARTEYFAAWARRVAAELGLPIVVDEARLAALAEPEGDS